MGPPRPYNISVVVAVHENPKVVLDQADMYKIKVFYLLQPVAAPL